jgi:non-ribosomal peptide synthetase component F
MTGLALTLTETRFKFGGLTWESISLPERTSLVDIDLAMGLVDGRLEGVIKYNTQLFDASTISAMAEHFWLLLAGIAENPDRNVSRFPLITSIERRKFLNTRTDDNDYQCDVRLHELFANHVRLAPNHIAAEDERGSALTYAELNDRAARLASLIMEVNKK